MKYPHTIVGNLDLVKISYDNFLVRKNRTVRIWTPTTYSEEEEPFDVIYMFDGSNLFDEATAFVHKEWQIDETIESLKGEIRPCVVVGIDASNDRISELFPRFSKKAIDHFAYKSDFMFDYLVNYVIPYVEEHYNVKKDRLHRSIGGSSMGGLMALEAAISYNEIFSKVYAFSPAFPLYRYGYTEMKGGTGGTNNDEAYEFVIRHLTSKKALNKTKIALCSGGIGYEKNYYRYVKNIKPRLVELGYDEDKILILQDKKYNHCEDQWAHFFIESYKFLQG